VPGRDHYHRKPAKRTVGNLPVFRKSLSQHGERTTSAEASTLKEKRSRRTLEWKGNKVSAFGSPEPIHYFGSTCGELPAAGRENEELKENLLSLLPFMTRKDQPSGPGGKRKAGTCTTTSNKNHEVLPGPKDTWGCTSIRYFAGKPEVKKRGSIGM